MHARLVLTMPLRLREILRHRYRPTTRAKLHWAALGERGAYLGLRILALFYRFTGRYGCMAALLPITLYFYLSNVEQRRCSREFLRRAYQARGLDREPGWIDSFRHCFGFACKTVDVFGAWMGGIGPAAIEVADRELLESVRASGQGLILIVSHLGNIEVSRATLDAAQRARIKLLVHTRHAENFARILRRFRPEAMLNTIQVAEVHPGTVMTLKDAIDEGAWVAIAGDRAPASDRVSPVPFLGSDAPFPQGPYLLAHLLECPVYLMFCLHRRGGYQLYFEKFADRIELPRQNRNAAIAHWAARYARRLESFCLIDPLQWYNFFDFWQSPSPSARSDAA
jgi:predicted LPLAT superfamily acyltransferase